MSFFWIIYLACAAIGLVGWLRTAKEMLEDGVDYWVVVVPAVMMFIPVLNMFLALIVCYSTIRRVGGWS